MVTSIAGYTPKRITKWLHVAQDGYPAVTRYIPNRNGNKPRIIVIHVQEGSNWGSWQHFHTVKASSTVLISKAGEIWDLVPEQHGPWTNGDVQKPDAVMISIMNRWGWDPNVYSLTIEEEGYSGGLPYTPNQLKSTIWQVAKWCRDYAIDAVYIVRHGQINSVSRSFCPERAPYTFTEAVRSAVKGTPVIDHEIYRDPWPVVLDNGTRWDGTKDVTVTTGPTPVKFFGDKRTVTVNVAALNGRQWASTASNLTPTGKTNGDKIDALGWVEGEEVGTERRWWVAVDGTRYWAGGTAETPSKKAPVPETPTDPTPKPDYGNLLDKVPRVLNGSVYYPFEDREGDAGRGRLLRVKADGNLREWAGTSSASRGTAQAGQEIWCSYWVRGEKIGDEDLWYVIDPGNGDPIHTGPRIWAGLVEERPD